ncbi:MAG: tRNA preQ1(34) S-adenosylmethionine ribosyltransferase-isomerase QueA [Burkholderiaceae bacterium]
MLLSEFDFELPESLIAQAPLATRSASRLLDCTRAEFVDRTVSELPKLLRAGDLLVFNDTKVINARLRATKSTGGKAEVLIERVTGVDTALAQVRASHAPPPGSTLRFASGAIARVVSREDQFYTLQFDMPAEEVLRTDGELPLPPYIRHAPDATDAKRYQTVFARVEGAVAAPTAGLHFDRDVLDALDAAGVESATLTLHVGAGTFQPVRSELLDEHAMHEERYWIPDELAQRVALTRRRGGRIVAVGTTTVRALESAADAQGRLRPGPGETRLFITPGYTFKVVEGLVTNFHLPKSTLLVLVSAFAGIERIRTAYQHAIARRYRFFSYGDAMLLQRA